MSLIISHTASEVWKSIGVEKKEKKRKELQSDGGLSWNTGKTEGSMIAVLCTQFPFYQTSVSGLVFGAFWPHPHFNLHAWWRLTFPQWASYYNQVNSFLINTSWQVEEFTPMSLLAREILICCNIQCLGQKLSGSFQIIDTWLRDRRLTHLRKTWKKALMVSKHMGQSCNLLDLHHICLFNKQALKCCEAARKCTKWLEKFVWPGLHSGVLVMGHWEKIHYFSHFLSRPNVLLPICSMQREKPVVFVWISIVPCTSNMTKLRRINLSLREDGVPLDKVDRTGAFWNIFCLVLLFPSDPFPFCVLY